MNDFWSGERLICVSCFRWCVFVFWWSWLNFVCSVISSSTVFFSFNGFLLNHHCPLQSTSSKKNFKKSSTVNWMNSDLRSPNIVWGCFRRGFLFSDDHDYHLPVNWILAFFCWVFTFLATIVYSNLQHRTKGIETKISQFWIRIPGFELQGANHYTIEPTLVQDTPTFCEVRSLVSSCSLLAMINVCLLIGFFLFFFESFFC